MLCIVPSRSDTHSDSQHRRSTPSLPYFLAFSTRSPQCERLPYRQGSQLRYRESAGRADVYCDTYRWCHSSRCVTDCVPCCAICSEENQKSTMDTRRYTIDPCIGGIKVSSTTRRTLTQSLDLPVHAYGCIHCLQVTVCTHGRILTDPQSYGNWASWSA